MFKILLLFNLYISTSIDSIFNDLLFNNITILTDYIINKYTREKLNKKVEIDKERRKKFFNTSIYNIKLFYFLIRIYQLISLLLYFEYNNFNYNIQINSVSIFFLTIQTLGIAIILSVYFKLGSINYYYGYILDKEVSIDENKYNKYKISSINDYINELVKYNLGLYILSLGFYLFLNEIVFFENSTFLFLNLCILKIINICQNSYFMYSSN